MELIGSTYKFDITLGFNGKIWIKAAEPRIVIILVGLLEKLQFDEGSLQELLNKLKSSQ